MTSSNARSSGAFYSKFCAEVNTAEPGMICSPLSAEILLGLLALGTTGTSREELLTALNMRDDDNVRQVVKSVIDNLQKFSSCQMNVENMTEDMESLNASRVHITLANRLYVMETANDLVKAFVEDAQKNFDAGIQKIDFGDPNAVDTINKWVTGKTNNKINDLLSEGSVNNFTSLVLVNAIYFKGAWNKAFEVSDTADGPFYINKAKTVNVPFMHITETFPYVYNADLDAQIAEFPFENWGAGFLVVRPNKIEGLASVMMKLAGGFELMAACKSMQSTMLKVSLPKFKVETTIDMVGVLRKLGIHGVFSPDCTDISRLIENDNKLCISMAVQKAYIDVDEEGCEAAAAFAMAVPMMLTEMLKLERDPCVLSINAESNHTA